MKRLTDALMQKMAQWVFKYRPQYLEDRLNAEVVKLASDLSIRTSMAFLDKEHLLHCAFCAQRFGLVSSKVNQAGRLRTVYLCQLHLSHALTNGDLTSAIPQEEKHP